MDAQINLDTRPAVTPACHGPAPPVRATVTLVFRPQKKLLGRRGSIALLAGPQFLWSYSVSFPLGYFDSDKFWKVRGRTVFGHMLVLVESQCFPKFDTPGSKCRLVNTNLAGAEVHCPLNFGFGMSQIVFQGIKQVCTIPGRSLPDPAQA